MISGLFGWVLDVSISLSLLLLHASKVACWWYLQLTVDLKIGPGVAGSQWCWKSWQYWFITATTSLWVVYALQAWFKVFLIPVFLMVAHKLRRHAVDILMSVERLGWVVDVVVRVEASRKMRNIDWIVSKTCQRFLRRDQIHWAQVLQQHYISFWCLKKNPTFVFWWV